MISFLRITTQVIKEDMQKFKLQLSILTLKNDESKISLKIKKTINFTGKAYVLQKNTIFAHFLVTLE